jgi:hypothetical protein
MFNFISINFYSGNVTLTCKLVIAGYNGSFSLNLEHYDQFMRMQERNC